MARNLIFFRTLQPPSFLKLVNRCLLVAKVSNVSSDASETRVFIFLNALRVGKSITRVTLSIVQALVLKYPFRCVDRVELD